MLTLKKLLWMVLWCFASSALAQTESALDWQIFPRGQLFRQLVADSKEPHFRLSVWYADATFDKSLWGLTSLAESFGLLRVTNADRSRGIQLDIAGGAFAQFDFLSESSDLINTDFIGSLPLTFKYDDWSARFRLYHQSSHLGDEFLLRNSITRLNLSFELLECLLAYTLKGWRFIAGGEQYIRTDPDTLERNLLHVGFDYISDNSIGTFAHGKGDFVPILGTSVKFWQQDDFYPSVDLKAGMGLFSHDDTFRDHRSLRVLAAFYHGISPFGQFMANNFDATGAGLEVQIDL